jgi:hypothetical protein
MSVMGKRDEIIQVCDALYWDAMGERKYLHTISNEPCHPVSRTIEDEKSIVAAWGNRLYVANQIAYIFTYSHHAECNMKIDLLDESEAWKHGADLITNPARFYRVLESIEYNLYSNGGQVMLSGQDMQRLKDLIAAVARVVVGEYQRGRA